jgi:hypothetical protein
MRCTVSGWTTDAAATALYHVDHDQALPSGLPMKMTATVPSSAAEIVANPAAFLRSVRADIPDFDYRAAAALAEALAEEELLGEMVSYREAVTGVSHTIFISPRGNTQHAPRIKVAIDPPDSIDPRRVTASVGISDGVVRAGEIPPSLLATVQRFELNRAVLIDHWEYRIDADELRQRLKSI